APVPRAIGDDEAKIANLRTINTRPVDLVEDTAADGQPDARTAQRRADAVFRATCPGRINARCARCAHGPTSIAIGPAVHMCHLVRRIVPDAFAPLIRRTENPKLQWRLLRSV